MGQGPTALAVGAGEGCLDIFSLVCHFFFLSTFVWETARYRLKYCLEGPLSPKPTNQPNLTCSMISRVDLPRFGISHAKELGILGFCYNGLLCCFTRNNYLVILVQTKRSSKVKYISPMTLSSTRFPKHFSPIT